MVGWTLVGEVKLLKRAREGGYLMGVKVRGRGVIGEEVSHLLFADDTLVFYKASQDQMVQVGCPCGLKLY